MRRRAANGEAGFTLIEVLLATLLMTVILTGMPGRDDLVPGNFSGEVSGHRWRVDVLPFYADFVDAQKTEWVPQTVVVRVQSPSGPILQINTVRLRRVQAQ